MRFDVSLKQIKTRELIAAEQSTESTVDLMARFMVGENGEIMPFDEAKDKILDLDLEALSEVTGDFLAKLRRASTNSRR